MINDNIPWPYLGEGTGDLEVPLREDYKFEDMWYLDTDQALPIFQKQAEIIIKNNSKGIVDIGCRHGPVLKLLHQAGYTDFNYMGFDTSLEPISIASQYWKDHNNIEFRNGSWDEESIFEVNFDVDQVIWSGVLIYRPADHFKFFNRITKEYYNSRNAIIQEPMWEQRHWDNRVQLHRITDQMDQYKTAYKNVDEHIVDSNIFAGKRLVLDIEL